MSLAPISERSHPAQFLVSESPGTISRDTVTVTVAAGATLAAGHVLGVLTATGKYVSYDNAGSDGTEEAGAVLYSELDNSAGVAPADFTGVVINWGAEVRKDGLEWAAGLLDAAKTAAYADLAGRGVKARD